MRTETSEITSHLIVVDDESLFQALRHHKNLRAQETSVGAAFSTCYRRQMPHAAYYLLYQPPENAHLHIWSAMAVLAKQDRFQTVTALSKGLNLGKSPLPKTPLLITEARACPYPALYQSPDPYSTGKQETEIYTCAWQARDNRSTTLKAVGYKDEYVAGYCKHPVHNGSLMPWAPEQFEQLSNQGIHMYSEIPAGIYDAGTTPAYSQSLIRAYGVSVESLDCGHTDPIVLADWLLLTQHTPHSKSTGSTSTIS